MNSQPDDALAQLTAAGVAVWLDDISRERLSTGNLEMLMRDLHVRGVTSNPTIFAKAISSGSAYQAQIADLAVRGVDVDEAARAITTYDIRWACDVLRPVYDETDGLDGRVSIEVDPRIARDTEKTIAEARALWWLVDRPNLFIKIPATAEGLPAITQCLFEAGHVGADHVGVALQGEDQGHVDADPLRERRGDRRHALSGRRDLDEQVRPVHHPPQRPGLGDCLLCLPGQPRVDFE